MKINQHTTGWNDERVAELKRLWTEGFSASQCAARLGGVTRNGVIGKIHRLHGYDRKEHPASVRHSTGDRKKARPTTHQPKPRPKPVLKVMPIETGPPEALMITLMHLDNHQCRYPLGEATGAAQLFCGAPKDIESSWCPFHRRIVFRPTRPFMEKRFAEKVAA